MAVLEMVLKVTEPEKEQKKNEKNHRVKFARKPLKNRITQSFR